MSYKEPKRSVRDGNDGNYCGHDELIDRATNSGKYNDRTDAYAEGVGFLGMDDIDRLRRRRLNRQTQ